MWHLFSQWRRWFSRRVALAESGQQYGVHEPAASFAFHSAAYGISFSAQISINDAVRNTWYTSMLLDG